MSDTQISAPSLETLLEELDNHPMRALHRCRDAFRTSANTHYQTVHETIAFIVAFVLHLERSAQARADFLMDPYWEGKPQRPKEKNLTRLAAMFVVGAKQSHGALYQQANQYSKVAQHFLGIEIEPVEISEQLRRTPIYKIIDKLEAQQEAECDSDEAEESTGNNNTGDNISSEGNSNYSDDDNEDDDHNTDVNLADDNHAAGSSNINGRERTTSTAGSETRRGRRYPFRQDQELAVAAEGYWKLFFDRMQPDDETPVMIRRLPDKDGWAKFKVSDLLSDRDYRAARPEE